MSTNQCLTKSEAGNQANAKAQAIEIDRLRAVNAELRMTLQLIAESYDVTALQDLARAALAKAKKQS